MNKSFCFSILALKPKYQLLAQEFAENIEKHSPGTTVVIGTDNPDAFKDCSNVFAFKLEKKGILHCYHDKRFVIEKALTKFKVAIQIDADTKIFNSLPESINESTGLAAVHIENLVEHAQKYNPQRLIYLRKLGEKLDIDINSVSYIGESLFAVSADGDKTSEFLKQWDLIARYLELHRIHAGSGHGIGLAAAKAGLEITKPSWLESINQAKEHLDAAAWKSNKTLWSNLSRRIDYHYRFNKARIFALKDFNFYYR
ncbi:MAG: hypothetical protein AAGA80_27335 [Cyanobacteria bacterium P01_F01_bin.143]